jgi:hypothetical protein
MEPKWCLAAEVVANKSPNKRRKEKLSNTLHTNKTTHGAEEEQIKREELPQTRPET